MARGDSTGSSRTNLTKCSSPDLRYFLSGSKPLEIITERPARPGRGTGHPHVAADRARGRGGGPRATIRVRRAGFEAVAFDGRRGDWETPARFAPSRHSSLGPAGPGQEAAV